MIQIPREEFKKDPVFRKVYELILKNHRIPKHTEKVLLANKHIKDFCEEARHFAVFGPFFIHYNISNWYAKIPGVGDGVQTRVDSITFYDNFMEYEAARMRQLHGADDKDIPNIN